MGGDSCEAAGSMGLLAVLGRIVAVAERVESRLERQEILMTALSDAFAQMKAEVAAALTVDASTKVLIKSLADQLATATAALQAANPGVDASEVLAVVAQLKAGTDGLAADVVANTVADPAAMAPPAAPAP